ncbi:prolipoprotein diacylglyceryl transferase [Pseudoduganella eburnea]|uniref:Phosphatidylglycerol--prolipoprotein diacylglyceryl transferase n=2 Tax=Massilia eburnea TaxID=1776165 RepID=A0A6L6QF70_9BURK|nr:prolipoprotein diacylglyceryl transferase [Massilia eburnea]
MPLTHPMPNPIAFQIGPIFGIGPLSIHWYGLMYVLAFAMFIVLGRVRIKQPHIAAQGWTKEDLDDMLFYGMLGVIVGGRLGEVFFYQPDMLLAPWRIIRVWEGGMSYHGGFLGVLIGMALWARKRKRNLLDVYDFIAPLVPLGYAAGRMGNFINAELPGRVVSDPNLPWAMIYPNLHDNLPRHPSAIYQMLVDGILVFCIIWPFARKARPRLAVGALYVLLYGCARFFTEWFRTPDWEINVAGLPVTSGQMLSLPMIIGAIIMLAWAYRSNQPNSASQRT